MNPIPPDALKQHLAIIGKTGSGKTSTEKLAVEQVVAEGFRVCVLDSVKSDWWGITSSSDGKRAGLPFQILGGPHGHVPLHSSAGKVIGQLVGSGKLPLSILDMADFEAGGLQSFFIDFAQSLLRHAKGVVYLVIEEAHEFAPKERAGVGPENLAIHWAKKLATQGRSKGIRLIVATQRTQALHNAVLGSCESLIAHRLSTPADQKPVTEWLKANTDKATAEKVMESMSSLPTGVGWICCGEAKLFEKVKFPKFKTYDNAATPTGDSTEIKVKTAAVDQDALRALIGVAVQDAKDNDPTLLRKRIRELEAAQKAPPVAKATHTVAAVQASQKEVERWCTEAYRLGYEEGCLETTAEAIEWLGKFAATLTGWKPKGLKGKPKALQPLPPKVTSQALAPVVTVHAPQAHTSRAIAVALPGAENPATDALTAPQRKVMEALAFWRSVGHNAPTRAQVGMVAGYTPSSGRFGNLLGQMRTAGLISYPSTGLVKLEVDPEGGVMTTTAAAERLRSVLSTPQRNVLGACPDDEPYTREVIGISSGYEPTSGRFHNLIGSLCTLGVLEKKGPGMVQVAAWVREVLA